MNREEVLDVVNIIYERISHSEDFVDGKYTEALEVLIDYYEVGLIEELKKIKEEIKDLDLGFFDEDYRAGVARGIMEVNKILNNHISELKGDTL